MEKKIVRLFRPGFILLLFVLAVFTGVTFYYGHFLAGAFEAAAVVGFGVMSVISYRRRRREIVKSLEAMSLTSGLASGDPLLQIPMPVALVRVNGGEILWCNENFRLFSGCPAHYLNIKIQALLPNFALQWVAEGREKRPELYAISGRYYEISSTLVRPAKENDPGQIYALLYWKDSTEEIRLTRELAETKPVVAEILCDNYDEIAKGNSETAKASAMAQFDDMLNAWTARTNGVLKRVDRDRYLLLFTEKGYTEFARKRFDVLESAKKIVSQSGIGMTVSIGVGREGGSWTENEKFAHLALDMALSRGGDQAVVKNRLNYEFFGGTTKEVEKRTKVKSRMMAGVLKSLIEESSRVFVMGHRIADLDSLGGAAGVVCAARCLGKKANIVIDRHYSNAETMIDLLESNPAYDGVMISGSEAMMELDADTLLIIVDTNRATYVEDTALLESANRVAVIDHHRRVADYIDNATLNIHEPAASSVCELIAELLQNIAEPGDLLRVEASAMMAGIVLDTKSFMQKTGSRTFEAAAYLRRSGADQIDVKKLFQSDLENYITRAELVKKVVFFGGNYALSESDVPVDRAVAAQAADDMMNLSGVGCSFVLFPFEDTVSVSARSLGRVNVQLIMEKLGGGGHFTTAGAQVKGKTMAEVRRMLEDALTVYEYEQK